MSELNFGVDRDMLNHLPIFLCIVLFVSQSFSSFKIRSLIYSLLAQFLFL